ncbi:MAG: UDP-N-acetylglucosamine--N-acetylmuramyl-(pentapeptide) pyrophosphoryl-undecaprenol N-acetylglucosamine transferase [Chlamydiia bacterium]
MSQQPKIALSVGGTFGHLNPALEAAKIAKEQVFLIGIGLKESPFLKDVGIEIISLDGARRVWKLIKSCGQAFFVLQKKNPKIVICFGSFHSFPAAIMGLLLGKSIWVFEPNAQMGKVNRFFSFFAHKILCYDEKLTLQYPHRGLLVAPPLKIKDKDVASRFFRLGSDRPILLIVGGSSGAKSINEWLLTHPEELKKYALIHLIGPNYDKDRFTNFYQKIGVKAFVENFITNLDEAMLIADIAISRAGASTLKELNFYRVPTVIIPFEGAYQHQKENAQRFLEEGGIGKILMESEMGAIFDRLNLLLGKKETIQKNLIKGREWNDIISLA